MLKEFEELEARYGTEKGADLRKACRFLIRNQFAYSGDRGVAIVYNTLVDNRFRHVADALFDSLGYRVQRNAEEQWVGIVLEDDDPGSVPKLRLDETIVVLVLGSHWQEDADVGNLLDRATSLTTANALYERYRDIVQGAGKAAIATARFTEILRELSSRNILALGELDRDQQDREVEIRPMIKLLVGSDALKRLEGYVRSEEAAVRPQRAAGASHPNEAEASGDA